MPERKHRLLVHTHLVVVRSPVSVIFGPLLSQLDIFPNGDSCRFTWAGQSGTLRLGIGSEILASHGSAHIGEINSGDGSMRVRIRTPYTISVTHHNDLGR